MLNENFNISSEIYKKIQIMLGDEKPVNTISALTAAISAEIEAVEEDERRHVLASVMTVLIASVMDIDVKHYDAISKRIESDLFH